MKSTKPISTPLGPHGGANSTCEMARELLNWGSKRLVTSFEQRAKNVNRGAALGSRRRGAAPGLRSSHAC